ncbi:Protein phosphatase 2C [Plasmodium coatneyi]|uniref:Protein phosphatase 2C n=1 Tax=Plasmodium coatneyi TaxID=208452 RepID=A0A1B1E798_9APIC|nr:Protein phosphatase 2C [Plasmodium coatneyi]ANQ10871.1 Protein phosphatase 2C [Plasmodium coatneyi]
MVTRDKDESELEDEGGDNSFRGDGDGQINGLSDSGSSGVEVQMVVPGGTVPYGKIRKEDKAEAIRKGKEASLRMDVEHYAEKEAHPSQRLFTEDPFEEVSPIQDGNEAHVRNEQMDNINFKAKKVVGGEEENEPAEGAYGYVSDGSGSSGRVQNGGVNRGGVPEDVIILRDDEIGDSHRRRENLSGEELYTCEDEERKNNHMMKKGYHKMGKDNPMDKMAHKSFNNVKYEKSNDCTVIATEDAVTLGSSVKNSDSHKRSAPLFDDPSVKEKKKIKNNSGEEAGINGQEEAECGLVRDKGGDQAKVLTKKDPRGRDVKDNFHLYCKNHNKIFGDADGGDLSKCENGGMMNSTREVPSGDVGSDHVEPLDSSTVVKQENEEETWKNQLNEISNIIYYTNGEDDLVDEINNVEDNHKENKIIYPSIYEDDKKEWFLTNEQDDWLVHKMCDWLYNVKDKLYFNIKTQGIYYVNVKDGSFVKFENSFDERGEVNMSQSDSQDVHKNSSSFELDSHDPLVDKKGKTTNTDGKNAFANMNDMVNDHSVGANRCVYVEDSGSRGSNSSRVVSRSSSGDGGTEGDSGSSILRSDRMEKRNGVLTSGSPSSDSAAREDRSMDNNSSDNPSADSPYTARRRPCRENGEVNDETVEEFSMVLEDDLVCGTYSKMGDHNRCENEDFYVTKEILDLNNVSESDGLCFFSGVFDGHGGSNCARYVMNHLKTNLIAKFRQSFLITCKKQCKDKESKLNDLSVEIRALYDSCIKGFDMTDKNYIELSKKYDYKDGSTACVVLIYGPDDDGSLKVLCANCGDSGALICHDRKPVKLSLRHKPDLQEERVRILKCGGIIANINGINRIITKHKVKGQTGREKTFLALSTSRSFGDISYKIPRKIVLCKPFISVYTIDFDMDSFLVLATDGILNVLTDKEIIDIVWRNIHRKPEEAAEEVVHEASRRDSTDDKTCTVIFFYWRKDIFRGESEDPSLEAPPREEAPGEDINMFSEVF